VVSGGRFDCAWVSTNSDSALGEPWKILVAFDLGPSNPKERSTPTAPGHSSRRRLDIATPLERGAHRQLLGVLHMTKWYQAVV